VADGVNGLLAPQNPEAIAESIHRLFSDASLYSALSRHNVSEARRYSWDVTTDAVSSVYGSL
jgi:glycosyltransferase involved in cell wall biosynthesis